MDSGFYRILLAFAMCLKPSYSENYHRRSRSDNKVTLSSDSPTTFGGTTTFFAQLLNCGGQEFRFCFESSVGNNCLVVSTRSCNYSISTWRKIGKKEVIVTVERTKPNYKKCGSASTDAFVTDTITATLKTKPDGDKLNTGPVLLHVLIHDPSHMFTSPRYYWDYGDGTYLNNTNLGQITHNFTEGRLYHVKVVIFATAHGRLFNGTTYKGLSFKVNLNPKLMVIDSNNVSTITLSSEPGSKTVYVALGRLVQLIIAYNNPYSVVQKCSSQWSISPSTHACSINYVFTEEDTTIYMTPTFQTKQGNISAEPFSKKIVAQEPVSQLTLESNNITSSSKYLITNVSCQGNSPFKICWRLSRSSSKIPIQGEVSSLGNCSGLLDSCTFFINHTIILPGTITLDIQAINRVGSAHLVEQFSIPKPTPRPHKADVKTAVDVVVPLLICITIVIVLVLFARKVYTIRHRSVLETANFDFRDEDCRSVDSLNLDNKWCPSWRLKFWRKFSKRKENYPLLDRSSSTQTFYSVIL